MNFRDRILSLIIPSRLLKPATAEQASVTSFMWRSQLDYGRGDTYHNQLLFSDFFDFYICQVSNCWWFFGLVRIEVHKFVVRFSMNIYCRNIIFSREKI